MRVFFPNRSKQEQLNLLNELRREPLLARLGLCPSTWALGPDTVRVRFAGVGRNSQERVVRASNVEGALDRRGDSVRCGALDWVLNIVYGDLRPLPQR